MNSDEQWKATLLQQVSALTQRVQHLESVVEVLQAHIGGDEGGGVGGSATPHSALDDSPLSPIRNVAQPAVEQPGQDVVDLTSDAATSEDAVGDEQKQRKAAHDVSVPSGDEEADRARLQRLLDLGLPHEVSVKLKPHQREGCEFLVQILRDNRGCVVGDAMGLGKTMQMIASLRAFSGERDITRVLIVVPTTLIAHWDCEIALFNGWLREGTRKLEAPIIIESSLSPSQRMAQVTGWSRAHGTGDDSIGVVSTLIMGYDMFRELTTFHEAQQLLCRNPGADVLILDEGHRIRNLSSSTCGSLSLIQTQRKIVLSGYPLQNNLTELYSMIEFAVPDDCTKVLGTLRQFQLRFEKTIAYWRKHNLLKSRRRAWLLFDMLRDTRLLLRRDSSLVISELPPFRSIVLNVSSSAFQKHLYAACLNSLTSRSVLDVFAVTSMISDHPVVVQRVASAFDSSCSDSEMRLGSVLRRPWLSTAWKSALEAGVVDPEDACHSGKMVLALNIILESKRAGDQLVIFSRWINSLTYVEEMIERHNRAAALMGTFGSLIRASRFDGRTALAERQSLIDDFRNQASTADVMLISTLCGEGISLVSANRVIILDVNWNPSHDQQAALRVFRYGQSKPVFVYRFVQDSCIEELIFKRQLLKMELANWVLDRCTDASCGVDSAEVNWSRFVQKSLQAIESEFPPQAAALIDLSEETRADAVTSSLIQHHSIQENAVANRSQWIISAFEERGMIALMDGTQDGIVDEQRAFEEYEWDSVYETSERQHLTKVSKKIPSQSEKSDSAISPSPSPSSLPSPPSIQKHSDASSDLLSTSKIQDSSRTNMGQEKNAHLQVIGISNDSSIHSPIECRDHLRKNQQCSGATPIFSSARHIHRDETKHDDFGHRHQHSAVKCLSINRSSCPNLKSFVNDSVSNLSEPGSLAKPSPSLISPVFTGLHGEGTGFDSSQSYELSPQEIDSESINAKEPKEPILADISDQKKFGAQVQRPVRVTNASKDSPFLVPIEVRDPLRAYQRQSGVSVPMSVSPSGQALTDSCCTMTDLILGSTRESSSLNSRVKHVNQRQPFDESLSGSGIPTHGRMLKQLASLKNSSHFAKLAEQRKQQKCKEAQIRAEREKARNRKRKQKNYSRSFAAHSSGQGTDSRVHNRSKKQRSRRHHHAAREVKSTQAPASSDMSIKSKPRQ